MSHKLQNKIGASPYTFCGAGILVALVTLSWQSAKAAISDPVNALRNE